MVSTVRVVADCDRFADDLFKFLVDFAYVIIVEVDLKVVSVTLGEISWHALFRKGVEYIC